MCLTSEALGLALRRWAPARASSAGGVAGVGVSTTPGAAGWTGAGVATGARRPARCAWARRGRRRRRGGARGLDALGDGGDARRPTGPSPTAEARIAEVANTDTHGKRGELRPGHAARLAQQLLDLRELEVDALQLGGLAREDVEAQVVADRHLVVEAAEVGLHDARSARSGGRGAPQAARDPSARSRDHDRVGQLLLLLDVALAAAWTGSAGRSSRRRTSAWRSGACGSPRPRPRSSRPCRGRRSGCRP